MLSKKTKSSAFSLILDSQHAFRPDSHMSDDIILSHELMDVINRNKNGKSHFSAIKVDMSKAYLPMIEYTGLFY